MRVCYNTFMRVTVIAHPNAKKPRIEIDLLDTLHVYVHEPPLAGKANKAVLKALADHFNTKSRNITFITGEKSKHKIFEILES